MPVRLSCSTYRLAFAEIASQLTLCGVELCLVIAKVHAVAVNLFHVTPDFLTVF